MDVSEIGGKNNPFCGNCLWWLSDIDRPVGIDREDVTFLHDELVDEEVLNSILFTWTPLGLLTPDRCSAYWLFLFAVVLRERDWNFINDVACSVKTWAVAIFLGFS